LNRNKGDKKIRDKNIGGIGGLRVGSEVDRMGLNSTPLLWPNPMRPALVGKLIKRTGGCSAQTEGSEACKSEGWQVCPS